MSFQECPTCGVGLPNSVGTCPECGQVLGHSGNSTSGTRRRLWPFAARGLAIVAFLLGILVAGTFHFVDTRRGLRVYKKAGFGFHDTYVNMNAVSIKELPLHTGVAKSMTQAGDLELLPGGIAVEAARSIGQAAAEVAEKWEEPARDLLRGATEMAGTAIDAARKVIGEVSGTRARSTGSRGDELQGGGLSGFESPRGSVPSRAEGPDCSAVYLPISSGIPWDRQMATFKTDGRVARADVEGLFEITEIWPSGSGPERIEIYAHECADTWYGARQSAGQVSPLTSLTVVDYSGKSLLLQGRRVARMEFFEKQGESPVYYLAVEENELIGEVVLDSGRNPERVTGFFSRH